ncbi:MAG: lipocalin-like domain-containing protein [Burkholderiaceae bacterium]|nr:lipocalin-like domain-containing protein [Burkholderiaceae bacterium]
MARRGLLALACIAPRCVQAQTGVAPRALAFPRDHGAHPDTRTEWWYATGWLHDAQAPGDAPAFGFQLTFFRSRTGLAAGLASRFAARQLLFAHAALTDLAAQRLLHAERIARWNDDERAPRAAAARGDTRVHIGDWRFERNDSAYRASLGDTAAGFAYRLSLAPTQPLLLQGDAGFSRKGPDRVNASHYYSQPQLAVSGELRHAGRTRPVRGRAWLDHEWSESLMPDGAVGWDWIGINLADGSALTAFALRRADRSAVWTGGSHRARNGSVQAFAADAVRFEPLAHWTSPATRARYPVRWRVHTPAGTFDIRALLEAQELDSRTSTGAVYWEGLAELRNAHGGPRLGLGYLEMTGYASALRL